MIVLIISTLILMLVTAMFSCAEAALGAANRVRLIHLADGGNRGAKRALKLLERFSAILTTILVINNVLNIIIASLSTLLFVGLFGDSGVAWSTLVLTVMMILFCEILPKTIARFTANTVLIHSSAVLLILSFVLTPITFLIDKVEGLIKKLLRKEKEEPITESELKTIIDEISVDGILEEDEQRLVKSALDFDEKDAENILIPRVDMVTLRIDTPADKVKDIILSEGYSRYPVIGSGVDDIVGVISAKDFWKTFLNKGSETKIADIMKQPIFIAPQTKISDALSQMQKSKTHMAMVSDEFGGIMGLVALEDILEELVGEIWDEHDEVVSDITQISETEWTINPLMHIDEVFEFFERPLPADAEVGDSVVSWVIDRILKLPRRGDHFNVDFSLDGQEGEQRPLAFVVTDVKDNRILGIKVVDSL